MEIAWGAVHPCISCHKTFFRSSVCKIDISKMKKSEVFYSSINLEALQLERKSDSEFWIKNSFWLCLCCKNYLKRDKMPKLSSKNALSISERPDYLNLTVVENLPIAPRINCITD